VAAVRDERRSSSTPRLLSIGELAERTGVATSALRYYDELGLVRPTEREAGGRRRYAGSAVAEVGVIRFFQEVGFTLADIDSFLAADEQRSRQEIIDRKLAEFTEQQHQLQVARELLEHSRTCPAGDPLHCARFWSIIEGTAMASRSRTATRECTKQPESDRQRPVGILPQSDQKPTRAEPPLTDCLVANPVARLG
jgi:DNA-binding transcriptional MerR regulator